MAEKAKAYLNKGQRYVWEINANAAVIVAARRFGKSDGVVGPAILYNVQHMPGSNGFIYQVSFKQLLQRTLPAALAFLRRYGYIENVHYFIGRKAPDWMGFAEPVLPPKDWTHAIHFYNGTVIHLLSQDVKFSANSLTCDWGIVDEGRSINKEKFFEEVMPTLSGTSPKFKNCHKWKGILIVSDMPTSKQGQWVVEMENRMDPELIKGIEETIKEIRRIKHHYSHLPELPESALRQIREQEEILFEFRKHAFLYKEFDTIENLEIVGPEYIRQMKRDLPPVIFQTSIMNKRIRKLTDGFYPNLDPEIHYYVNNNNTYLSNLRTEKGTLDLKRIGLDTCLKDGDIIPDIPLAIAFDYNSKINWVITGQRADPKMRTLSSFFVKTPKKIRELCKIWCDYYDYILDKKVIYYFNTTALDSGYADEESESYADIIYSILTSRGWEVEMVCIGNTWGYMKKHIAINDALTGAKYLWCEFNKENNEFLLPAMEMCGTRFGRTGFEKDKSGEKLGESEDDPLELRTDGTDAWDDLFIGLNFFPRQYVSSSYGTVYS